MNIIKRINTIAKPASLKRIAGFALLVILSELLFVLLITPTIKASSGAGLLDSLAFAELSVYKAYFEAYTAETRFVHYLSTSLDMIFPLFYGGLIYLLILRFGKRESVSNAGLWLVLLTVIFDYAENLGIVFSLSHYKKAGVVLVRYLQVSSSAKSILLSASIIVCMIIIFDYLLIVNKRKKGGTNH